MTPLKVRPHVHAHMLTSVRDAIARSTFSARDALYAGPAHVCEQEGGQAKNMSYRELTGSHSSPRNPIKVQRL